MRCLRRRMPLRSDLSLRISPESRKSPSGFFVYPAEVRLYLQHRFIVKKYPLDALLLGAFLAFLSSYLWRDLWFDEALTIQNFALLDSAARIYRSYVIPNNHIVYTVFLNFWLKLAPGFLPLDFWCRILSVLSGGGTLAALFYFFRKRITPLPLFLALFALAMSSPFLIYATAVRGYMLSMLWVVLTLHYALNYVENSKIKDVVLYGLFSLLCIGTIPSNLAALAGVVLYTMPLLNKKFWMDRRFWVLAVLPNVLFMLFYLPIAKQFFNVLQLGEGWQSRWALLLAFAAGIVTVFLPLLPFLKFKKENVFRYGIFLLPIAFALTCPTPPFPRVFLPFFPLFALLAAEGIAACKEKKLLYIGLAVFLWGALMQTAACREFLSEKVGGGAQDDDYFYGYYMRPTHTPAQVINAIRRAAPHGVPAIYMSFGSDPWPLMFYSKFSGYPAQTLFDGPWGKVQALPAGSYVVLRSDESPQCIAERFRCTLVPVAQIGRNHVYSAQ